VKVLVSWLRELVDVPVSAAQLARDLHMAGFEVASVEPLGTVPRAETPVGTVPLTPTGSDPRTGTTRGSDPEDDAVIDFEITANRPDCLSLMGLAREVATRYDSARRVPAHADLGPVSPDSIEALRITIEDASRCPRYCAAVADVRIGPSPSWLTERLTAAGIRSINNIVDVTNYVLLELGHPMHAFDLDRLAGRHLRVRLAQNDESLKTLDGQQRKLDAEMLVIADDSRAQALAGVMGGADSEVSSATKTIAIESAWFLPTSVRRTSKKIGLSTEASYRFERGADFAAPSEALARACALLEQIGAGAARRGWIDASADVRTPRLVRLELARVAQVLGVAVPAPEIRRILTGLGFLIGEHDEARWVVSVPSWRNDVARDVDLIEEVARHYGYDRLPTTFPALTAVPAKPERQLEIDRALRRFAAGAGFNECVTFSFIGEQAAQEFAAAADLVPIANPLSETFAVLRPSLLPGLVDALSHNRRHGRRDVRLFELGTRFLASAGEHRTLALGWLGASSPEHWSEVRRPADLFDLKGVVETIGVALGLALTASPTTRPYLVPGRTAVLAAAAADRPSREFGVVGQLLPALAIARDIPVQDEVYVAELDLDAVANLVTLLDIRATRPLPRFPSIIRDLSILVADTLPASQLRGTIRSVAPQTLARVAEFDRYQGKGIPDGQVSLSYRLTFQAPDRTLTDAEVDAAMLEVVDALTKEHGAVRR
jgi:phenylalanyl-tRNA synthetase beta chain